MMKLECIGGPRDGDFIEVSTREVAKEAITNALDLTMVPKPSTVRVPNMRSGGQYVYDVAMRDGAFVLAWEGARRD